MKLSSQPQRDDDETPLNESELPEWIFHETERRRNEMLADPKDGMGHEETWEEIFNRKR